MVDGLYAGRHRSPRRGQSAEFYDFRPYSPGDEPRRVDWKLFGRTDRLYVRRFRHDAELAVHLLLDRSSSMDFAALRARNDAVLGGRPQPAPTKLRYAQQLAAALAYLAIRQNDRVSLTFIDESASPAVPLGSTTAHLHRLTASLESLQPHARTQPRAALAAAHAAIGSQRGRRGLLILISDLLARPADWLAGLTGFARDPFDILVLQILTPDELDLGSVGAAQLIDSETARRVRTAGPDTRRRYRQAIQQHQATLRAGFAQHQIAHHLIRTDVEPIESLRRVLARP